MLLKIISASDDIYKQQNKKRFQTVFLRKEAVAIKLLQ